MEENATHLLVAYGGGEEHQDVQTVGEASEERQSRSAQEEGGPVTEALGTAAKEEASYEADGATATPEGRCSSSLDPRDAEGLRQQVQALNEKL